MPLCCQDISVDAAAATLHTLAHTVRAYLLGGVVHTPCDRMGSYLSAARSSGNGAADAEVLVSQPLLVVRCAPACPRSARPAIAGATGGKPHLLA